MKNTIRVNFDFPKKHYPILKMLIAQKGLSLKDYATGLFMHELEEFEDKILSRKAKKRLKEMDQSENIDFDDATRLAGWDDK